MYIGNPKNIPPKNANGIPIIQTPVTSKNSAAFVSPPLLNTPTILTKLNILNGQYIINTIKHLLISNATNSLTENSLIRGIFIRKHTTPITKLKTNCITIKYLA